MDGAVDVVPQPRIGRTAAVLGFTAHHVVAADVSEADVLSHLPDHDLGAPMSVAFLQWLGARIGAPPGVLDITFVALPDDVTISVLDVEERDDLVDHPRVQRAARYRDDGVTYRTTDGNGLVVLGHGFAGRLEMAFEVEPAARGAGLGRRLAATARHIAPPDETLYAQVSPGNVASVRAMLAAGYRPIGSEVLFATRA